MAGIYIHIPFCKSKCGYCNFFSVASSGKITAVLEAICLEINLTRDYLQDEVVDTVYFGGGTPSRIDPALISRLLREIQRRYPITDNPEITLEANPEDLSAERLKQYTGMGINRISTGIQSFDADELRYLDRRHDAGASLNALTLLASSQLSSFSIDLIYGIPGQSEMSLKRNLELCIEAGVPHISCYSLTVEPGTLLHRQIADGTKTEPGEALFHNHFHQVRETLTRHGYQQYEISNFAKEGHLARHNTRYWSGGLYLGLGPSAHSYNGSSRRWNISSIGGYIEKIAAGNAIEGEEILTPTMIHNEFLMTRLRTVWGIGFEDFEDRFGKPLRDRLSLLMAPFVVAGWIRDSSHAWELTPAGQAVSDYITASLFL